MRSCARIWRSIALCALLTDARAHAQLVPQEHPCADELHELEAAWVAVDESRLAGLGAPMREAVALTSRHWRLQASRWSAGVGRTRLARLIDAFDQRADTSTRDVRAWEAFIASMPIEARALGDERGRLLPASASNPAALREVVAVSPGASAAHLGWVAAHAIATAFDDAPRRALATTYFAEDSTVAALVARTDAGIARCTQPEAWSPGLPYDAASSPPPVYTRADVVAPRVPPASAPPETRRFADLLGRLSVSARAPDDGLVVGTSAGVIASFATGEDQPRFMRWFGAPVTVLAVDATTGIVTAGFANSVELSLDATGEVLFIRAAGHHVPIRLVSHGTTSVFVHADGLVLGLSSRTGERRFTFDLADQPLVDIDTHSIVLVGKSNGSVALLDLASGTVRWTRSLRELLGSAGLGTAFAADARPVLTDSHVLIGFLVPPVLLAIDRTTGTATVVHRAEDAILDVQAIDADHVGLGTRAGSFGLVRGEVGERR